MKKLIFFSIFAVLIITFNQTECASVNNKTNKNISVTIIYTGWPFFEKVGIGPNTSYEKTGSKIKYIEIDGNSKACTKSDVIYDDRNRPTPEIDC